MKKVFDFVATNFDTAVAIIISISAAIYSSFGGSQSILLGGIATTLGILAFGIIRDRYARDALSEQIDKFDQAFELLRGSKVTAESFFRTRENAPSWATRLQNAKTVDLCGLSLTSLAVTNNALVKNLKESGTRIRMIIPNPDNESIQQAIATRTLEAQTAEHHVSLAKTVLAMLTTIGGESKSGGKLEVKTIDQVPSFAFVGIDTFALGGKISVELYLTQTPLTRDPIFEIDARTDPRWFGEFREQFELFWKEAKPANPSNLSSELMSKKLNMGQ